MKKGWFFYCLTVFALENDLLDGHNNTINTLTHNVNRRYYHIENIKPSIETTINVIKNEPLLDIDPEEFEHDDIKKAVESLKEKSSDQFLHCWYSFCAYQNIHSDAFEKEFLDLVEILNSFVTTKACDKKSDIESVKTDDILFNFYIIKRLKKLSKLLAHSHYAVEAESKKLRSIDLMLGNELEFQHSRIQTCVNEIYQKKNLDPLSMLIQEYTTYRYSNDYAFLQEQLQLIFIVYKKMLDSELEDKTAQVVLHEMEMIEEISEHIQELSIEQALDVIDLITNKLILIREKEEEKQGGFIQNLKNSAYSAMSYFGKIF